METLSMIATLLGLWFGFLLFICWVFLEWAKDREEKTDMERIYKITKIGTKEVAIEAAESSFLACMKAGWSPERCEVVDITGEVIELKENGDLVEVVK